MTGLWNVVLKFRNVQVLLLFTLSTILLRLLQYFYSESSNWEEFYKNYALYCQVSLLRTLVNLFFMKRLFSQDTFFLGHFTRDKNIFILPGIQVFWCKKLIQNRYTSQGIQLLNKTLDLPGHCKYLPVISLRIKKNAIILPRSDQIPQKTIYLCISGKLVNLY